MQKHRRPGDDPLRGASVALVLGSGLGGLAARFDPIVEKRFEHIAGVGASTVAGHRGSLTLCRVDRDPCLVVSGRHHLYEGRPSETPALIAYLHELGISSLILTSAAGSAEGAYSPGQLVLVDDIIDFQFRRPPATSVGLPSFAAVPGVPQRGRLGMTARGLQLDTQLSMALWRVAREGNVRLNRGTMACLAGPAYETPTEVSGFRHGGVKIFSMSVAPEVASANALGMKVASIAVITNWATGISRESLHHADVLRRSKRAEGDLARLFALFLRHVTGPAANRSGVKRE